MDFSAALDTPRGKIEKPKVLPQGTYIWTVTKFVISRVKSANGEWDVVEFKVRAVSAEEDVDQDALAEFGDLKNAVNRISFMFTTASDGENERTLTQNRLDKFLAETLRVDGCDNDETTLKEMLAASPNCQFMGRAVWRPVGEDTYVDLKDPMPLD
jgi:hypothetical protein